MRQTGRLRHLAVSNVVTPSERSLDTEAVMQLVEMKRQVTQSMHRMRGSVAAPRPGTDGVGRGRPSAGERLGRRFP